MIHKEITIDISDMIDHMNDRERIEWITELVASIDEKGTIEKVRKIVNDEGYSD